MKVQTLEGYRISVGNWANLGEDAARVRHEVFIEEQNVPVEEEMDERDAECVHAVIYDTAGVPVATGRLLPDGHIGRMAVCRSHRGQGLGSMVLERLIDEARRRGHLQVALAAQVHAKAFYTGHGFIAEGPIFLDAGIDHINMRRILTA